MPSEASVPAKDAPRIDAPPAKTLFLLVTAAWAVIFFARLATPPDLMDKDQERPAAYIMDVVQNGNWLCQKDFVNDVTSKPPLYTWVGAALTWGLGFGRMTRLTLTSPSWLATLFTAWLMLAVGSAVFGRGAGFWGALFYLLSITGLRQVLLARTDALFAFTVFGAAMLACRAWLRGAGWTWFWLAAAAAALTKGPLGLVLAAGGLAATLWEKLSADPKPLRGSHWVGVGLFLLIGAGWFLWANAAMDGGVYRKMISKELVYHATTSHRDYVPGQFFYRPILYVLARSFPSSLFAFAGFWRVCRRPSADPTARRVERFLFCYFAIGLIIFSVAPHQRADLLWPILPPAIILAGREAARLFLPRRREQYVKVLMGAMAAVAAVAFIYYGFIDSRNKRVRRTVGMAELADAITREGGSPFPLIHVDTPYALQAYLNTLLPSASPARAAEALAGPRPAFVAVRRLKALEDALKAHGTPLVYRLARWPAEGEALVTIIGNRPNLRHREGVFFTGPFRVSYEGGPLESFAENAASLGAGLPDGSSAAATNVGGRYAKRGPVRFTIRIGAPFGVRRSGIVRPGESLEARGRDALSSGERAMQALILVTAVGCFYAVFLLSLAGLGAVTRSAMARGAPWLA